MANRSETVTLDRSFPNERLDAWLRRQYPAMSRGAIQRLIEEGHITVNGAKIKPTHTPRIGDVVRVEWPEVKPAIAQPEDIPLDILFEDEALLVLIRPRGMRNTRWSMRSCIIARVN
jgi:23S rRNA pseudouridine1911/1915/1917 synthase